jgi:streptomycin 3"-adenylyltransferase
MRWMNDKAIPTEISAQLSLACDVIERHLAPVLVAVHLYGSALEGGLQPYSDIDLMVTVAEPLSEQVRQALMRDLLPASRPPGQSKALRALEITVVARDDVRPWRYAPVRQLQFGEWLRDDIDAGIFEPAMQDADLAILLTKLRHSSIALIGPSAQDLFEPVPASDLRRVLSDTLTLWNAPPDWAGDERNVLLTLARIWYSTATGEIAPKHVAADWAIARLPPELHPVMQEARQAYLGHAPDQLADRGDQLTALIVHIKEQVMSSLTLPK